MFCPTFLNQPANLRRLDHDPAAETNAPELTGSNVVSQRPMGSTDDLGRFFDF
jgi:hypothetical protein